MEISKHIGLPFFKLVCAEINSFERCMAVLSKPQLLYLLLPRSYYAVWNGKPHKNYGPELKGLWTGLTICRPAV